MKYKVVGSQAVKEEIVKLLPDSFVYDEVKPEFVIYIVDDLNFLNGLPKSFDKKTYFYVTKNDRAIFESIKNFKINGVLFPPLNREKLLQKLANDVDTSENSDIEILKSKVIARAESLPALPTVIQKILRLTSDDKASFKEIINEVKKDQGLVGKILKIVNSPFYGIRKEITSVDRASVLLGVGSIKNIALAAFSMDLFNKNFYNYNTDSKKLWLHSFITGKLCEEIAKMCGDLDIDSLFLAGLLHDLGKVVLVDFLTQQVTSIDDESKLLGLNHAEVSEIILKKWNIGEEIINAIKNHHVKGDDRFGMVLYYSNILSKDDEISDELLNEISSNFNIEFSDLKPRIEMVLNDSYEEFF